MGYSAGDRVEFTAYNGRKYKVYLLRIAMSGKYQKKAGIVWEVKRQRHSHLGLIGEHDIVRKISSNFEGFYPNKPMHSDPQRLRAGD